MNQNEICTLLEQHCKAYQFLLWLDKEATGNPNVFSKETITAFNEKQSCIAWLEMHRDSIPQELYPDSNRIDSFANMLMSFFETSFHVQIQEFEGKILEARLCRKANPTSIQKPTARLRDLMITAMRRLASEEGIVIDQDATRHAVDHPGLRNDLWIWLYINDLNLRSSGKARGNIDHKIWIAIPVDIRRNMDIKIVWEARSHLVTELKNARNTSR
jgi:hypothetical protein